ncbi:MAG TPA: hypothetical protein VNV66_06870 [Pilimelia sp.]|nr:hypothetical protein [Pilimelia sp.]
MVAPAVVAATPASAARKCRFVLTTDPGEVGGRGNICRTWFPTGGGRYRGTVSGELKDLSSDYHSVALQESRDGKVRIVARTPNDYPGRTKKVHYTYSKVRKLYHRVCLVNYAQTKPAVYCSPWF